MEPLNLSQLYTLFKDTLTHCGTFLLTCDREDIEYHIFEEFDSDCSSFLHESNLRALLDGGYIDTEIYTESLRLSAAFRALEGTALWNCEAVTCDETWREVLELGDRVQGMAKAHEG